jgi:lipopolysaccharide biosynthesis glycosyltransferase
MIGTAAGSTAAHIHIVTGGNGNIAEPFMATLASLAAQRSPCIVHILDAGLRTKTEAAVQQLKLNSNGHFQSDWMPVSAEMLSGLPSTQKLPREAFLRLLIAELLPEVDRVIWLDTDTLAMQDLSELYQMDLAGKIAAAVPEYGACTLEDFVAKDLLDAYPSVRHLEGFNSGIMLIDLNAWRSAGVSDEVLALSRLFSGALKFADQDGLNVVLAQKWLPLDLAWNVQIGALRSIPRVPASRIHVEVLQRATALLASPKIVHFAGAKPWASGLRSPFRDEYFHLVQSSNIYPGAQFYRRYIISTWRAATFFIRRRFIEMRS